MTRDIAEACDTVAALTLQGLAAGGDFSALNQHIASAHGARAEIRIGTMAEQWDARVVDWLHGRSYDLFSFSPAILTHGFARRLATNWAWGLLLLLRYARTWPEPGGVVRLNLEDWGPQAGLAYCANGPGFHLIPDPIFLATEAYAGVRVRVDANALAWVLRRPVVFWRGASTGWHDCAGGPQQGWRELPRVVLCRLAQGADGADDFDVGLHLVTQLSPDNSVELTASGLMRAAVPQITLGRYQAHIDIDGNSSAGMGLFTKLASGSPVLKVQSAAGFRQWYYDRLVPWEHYIPVTAAMDDLHEQAAWVFAHPLEAEAIGARGRALALSMTLEGEIEAALPTIAAAFREGIH